MRTLVMIVILAVVNIWALGALTIKSAVAVMASIITGYIWGISDPSHMNSKQSRWL